MATEKWSEEENLLALLKVSLKYLLTSRPALPSLQSDELSVNSELHQAFAYVSPLTAQLAFCPLPDSPSIPSSDLLATALNQGFAEKSKASFVVKDILR